MKFSLLLITTLLYFKVWAQTDLITITKDKQPVREVIQEIEHQSKYFFIYQDNVIDEAPWVSLHLTNVTINEILREIENQTQIKGIVEEYQVILIQNQKFDTIVLAMPKKISGLITADDESPLLGVSVTIKGTTIGTLTDSSGFFELSIPANTDSISFSYIGMKPRTSAIGDTKFFKLILYDDVVEIQEVVAIGYGSIQKSKVTSSLSSLKSKAFEEFPVKTVEEGIKGQLAGVQVIQSSGQPGTGISVRIRGVSSIAGGNEPLYVIDGIPTSNIDVRELNGLAGFSPYDISSVEVLKDAMATSIYGSRAANGVILITTKDGEPGKLRIKYNSYISIDQVRKKMPLMNGDEYIDYASQYYTNATSLTNAKKQENLAAIQDYGNANTDWQDQIFRTALHHGHNLTFSGGNQKSAYFSSLNYIDQKGIVSNTDFKQYGFRMNSTHKLANWFEVAIRTSASKVIQNGFLSGDGTNTRNNEKSGMGATILAPPTVSVYDDDGNYSQVIAYPFSYEDLENPVAITQALDKKTSYNFIGGLDVTTKLLSGLSNTLRAGAEYYDRTHDYYIPSYLTQLGAQTAELNKLNRISDLFEDYITFSKEFRKLSLELVDGFSAQYEKYQTIELAGTVFPTDDLQNNVIQAASYISTPETNTTEGKLASFFIRMHLDYDDRYLLSVSSRSDGASVLSDGNKWAYFPAMALAWRISKENFMKGSHINDLLVRTSWGKTGNQSIDPYQSLYVGEVVNTSQGAGSSVNIGLSTNLPNENLTWETTSQFNTGLNLGVLNNKIKVVFDYYLRNTHDLLAYVALPGSSGYSYYLDNVGSVQNKGFEISLGSNILNKKNWFVDVDVNFSRNTNVVLSTKNNQDIIPNRTDDATRTSTIVRVGEPLYTFYMSKYLGLDQDGKPMYEDLNSDGIIDESDRQVAGSPLPTCFLGSNIFVSYRNLSLSMGWTGVFGAQLNNVTMMMLTEPEPTGNRVKNITEYYPSITDDFDVSDSDRFIEDASYVRLSNIKLAYSFTNVFNMIERFSIYMSAQNILTFTKYSGYDPEVNSFSDDNQYQGVDYVAFPQAKTITFGINLIY